MFQVESTKGLHYNFAHLALPILVLMNPKKFYGDISGRNNKEYLSSIWQGLANKMGISPSKYTFEVSTMEITKDLEAFIIKLPPPKEVPEAFLVAAVFQVKKQLFSKSVESVRYFTLELGKNPYDLSSNEYHFCEWTGNMATSPRHENYGRIVRADEKLFISAIKEVLSTGKLKKIKEDEAKKPLTENRSIPKEVVNNQNTKGKPSKPSIPDISDLLALAQKHTSLIEKSEIKTQENHRIITEIVHTPLIQTTLEQDTQHRVFPKGLDDANQYLRMSSEFMLRSIVIALVIGREYAEHYKDSAKSIMLSEQIDSLAIHESTQSELKRLSEYGVFWIMRLDEMCNFAGFIDKATMLHALDLHMSQSQTAILNAFKDGIVDYFNEVYGTNF